MCRSGVWRLSIHQDVPDQQSTAFAEASQLQARLLAAAHLSSAWRGLHLKHFILGPPLALRSKTCCSKLLVHLQQQEQHCSNPTSDYLQRYQVHLVTHVC
jgi:hypothetical protein